MQGLSPEQYERKKEEVAKQLVLRLDAVFPGLADNITFQEVGRSKKKSLHFSFRSKKRPFYVCFSSKKKSFYVC